MTRYEMRYALLVPGDGGVSGYFPRSRTQASIPDTRAWPYYGDLLPGGYIVDGTHLDFHVRYRTAVNGPMVSMVLPPGQRDRLDDPGPIAAMMAADPQTGLFGALVATAIADRQWQGLDEVALDTWIGYRRSRGARVGRRVDEYIFWEDGVTHMIRPALQRYRQEPSMVARPDGLTIPDTDFMGPPLARAQW